MTDQIEVSDSLVFQSNSATPSPDMNAKENRPVDKMHL